MNNCYLCGKEFNTTDVKKHDEHIIQQAVGGNLTANDILCSDCGGVLGKQIDEPFSKIFHSIATRLDIKKDRARNKQKISTQGKYVNLKYKFMSLSWSVKAKKKITIFDFQYQYNKFCNAINIKEIDVVWKDFKVTPVKPFHRYVENNTKVIIYTTKKNAKKYRKKVENDISKKFKDKNKPEIIVCDDLEGIVEYPFDMDNKAFKQGLAKIAIGFASKYNIKREDLALALEIDNNTKQGKIKNKIFALPFYPLGAIDKLIEIQKNKFEYYPYHNLILFTVDYDPTISNSKKVLICYIELFSTFQYYIVLSEEYYGESIYRYYAQQILKKDDYIVELGRRYYKERNIWLDSLRITEEYIEKKYQEREDESESRFEFEEELIQEEIIKQKYKFDFEEHIHNIVSEISNQFLLSQNKDMDSFTKFKQNLDLFLYLKYDEDEEIFSILSYRRFFYENDLKNYYSELLNQFDTLVNSDIFKKYGFMKMDMLNDYIQNENIRYKMELK